MEASRARLSESQRLSRTTAVIIRETRVTIERTLEMLDIGSRPGGPDHRSRRARTGLPGASRRPAPTVRSR